MAKRKFILVFLCLLSLILVSCAWKGPNKSLLGFYPETLFKYKIDSNFITARKLLESLAERNRQLSTELGKIPELQTSIDDEKLAALTKLIEVYFAQPVQFDLAFNQVKKIGKVEIRRYNTPLQALFWLAEEDKIDEIEILIDSFSLNRLLDRAWVLNNTEYFHRWKWRTAQARKLYDSCKDESLKRQIEKYFKDNRGATDYIIALAEKNPESFNHRMEMFDDALSAHRKRWTNFRAVSDRVNSPELIHYYIMGEYSFEPNIHLPPKETFQKKYGSSASIAMLGALFLESAGYYTFLHYVRIDNSECASEHAGAGIILENGLYMLVVDFPKGRTITGPFDINELEHQLRTGHCYPPPSLPFSVPLPDVVHFFPEKGADRGLEAAIMY